MIWSTLNASKANPHEGGFLALRHLQHGSVFSQVDKADHYTVESALLGVREWFSRMLYGVGYSATPGEGQSWNDVVDKQLDLVRYINGLPASERATWKAWAADNFIRNALTRAQDAFGAKLLTSRPADELVAAFLPDGAAFFTNINQRLSDAEPIAVVRRAFPNYFTSEPVVLAGTSHSSSSYAERARSGGGKDKQAGAQGASGANAGKKRSGPGSKADLAKMLSDGHFFMAGRVCDIQAVADSLKVGVDDFCWPVLFTTKKGDEALSVCPCPDKHGGLKSKWHKPPKGFKQDQLLKKFFTSASSDQLREAGWKAAKAKT